MLFTHSLPTALCRTAAVVAAAPQANPAPWETAILVIVLAFVPWIILGLHLVWREKKRTRELQQVADGLGFEFFPTGDPAYFAGLARLELFSRGDEKKLWNLLRGTSRSFEVGIFDYSYVKGTGKHKSAWKQTVICLQSSALKLPDFILSPKSFWNMIGAIFGHTEIEIEGHPVFSKLYALRGSDPETIGRTFTDATLAFFEEHLGLSSQGANDRLLLYKTSKRVKPDEIATFLEDGLKLLSLVPTTSGETAG